jgi:hypothetical protein
MSLQSASSLSPRNPLLSSRPRETGVPKKITDLRLMSLLVEGNEAEQLQDIVDTCERMLVDHAPVVERWIGLEEGFRLLQGRA